MFLHKTRADIILISWTLLMDQILYELGWWTLFSILAFNWKPLDEWSISGTPPKTNMESEHHLFEVWNLIFQNFYFWDPGIRSFVGEMQAFWPASGGNEKISTGRFSPKLNCLWRIMIFSIDGWKNSYGWKLSYISHPSFWKSWYLKKKILPRSNEIKVRVLHPPKFNIAPEKWWLDDYFPIGKVTFQGLC